MKFKAHFIGFGIQFVSVILFGQAVTPDIQPVTIQKNNNFEGFEILTTENQKLFVLAEHWHNIKSVPKATMKVIRYLYDAGNVRILAIEQGKSVAMMINSYLESGDTAMLGHITRNTMFWAKEHRQFFNDLRTFNLSVPKNERITVKSIDIEYKMESAIFMINQFIGERNIPESLAGTVGAFKSIYDNTREHREQYDGLSVMYYYEQDLVQNLVLRTINDLEKNSRIYIDFFEEHFTDFATMILEMDDGLTFDYTNPNNNYKFRDRIIYNQFKELIDENPDPGVLCVIGLRHATRGSSISNLELSDDSPVKDQVTIIRISALFNKAINAPDLRKINFNYPKQLKSNDATLIKHNPDDGALRNKKGFDYTLFINANGSLTPFENRLTEDY